MSYWFDKGDARRFPRIDMPVPLYLTPAEPIRDFQILGTGINYYPPSVSKRIQLTKLNLMHWQKLIQEQKEILDPVFRHAIDMVDYFRECQIKVSQGRMPYNDNGSLMELEQKLAGFHLIPLLKDHAPKTYNYLDLINDKFRAYLTHFYHSVNQSTPTNFVIDPNLPSEFPADKTIRAFAHPKFKKVPLAQSMYYLARYIDYHCRAYIEMLKDYAPKKATKRWPETNLNISASGFAIKLHKRYEPTTKVHAYLYFADTDETIKLSCNTIRTQTLLEEGMECNAFDFNFPTHQDQSLIKRQLERYQIKRCMDITL